MFGDALNKRKTYSTRYKGGGQQTALARKPFRAEILHMQSRILCVFWYFIRKSRECIFPGLNDAFGGAASILLPCSLGFYSRKPLKHAKKPMVFSYLQQKTMEHTRKPIVFWCLQLKTIENSTKPMCFKWKSIVFAKQPVCVMVFSMESHAK